MAETVIGNFGAVYDDEFFGAFNEVLAENTDVFNASANGVIRLVNRFHRGDDIKEAFWPDIGSLVTRRDLTSTSAGTATGLVNDDNKGPKLSTRWQIDNADDSFERVGASVGEFVGVVGEKVAKRLMEYYANFAVAALVQTTLDVTTGGPQGIGSFLDKSAASTNTLQVDYLIDGLATMGDHSGMIGAWLMHSKAFFNLVKDQANNFQFDRIAGVAIATGVPAALGLPIIVADNSSLINTDGITSGTDSYYTLGLMPGASSLDVTNVRNEVDRVTGQEQLVYRVQGETDFTLRVKGFDYTDTTRNPQLTAIQNAANWATTVDSVKSGPGFVIEHA